MAAPLVYGLLMLAARVGIKTPKYMIVPMWKINSYGGTLIGKLTRKVKPVLQDFFVKDKSRLRKEVETVGAPGWNRQFQKTLGNPEVASILRQVMANKINRRVAYASLTALGFGPEIVDTLLFSEEDSEKPWFALYSSLKEQGLNPAPKEEWDRIWTEYTEKHPEGKDWIPTRATVRHPPKLRITDRAVQSKEITDIHGMHSADVYGWDELQRRTEKQGMLSPGEVLYPDLSKAPGAADLTKPRRDPSRFSDTEILKGKIPGQEQSSYKYPGFWAGEDKLEQPFPELRPIRDIIDEIPSEARYTKGEALRRTNELARLGGSTIDPSRFSEEEREILGLSSSGNLPRTAWKRFWAKEQERGFLPEDDTNLLDKIVNFISKEPENNNNNKLTRRKGSPFKKGGRVKRRTNKIMKQYAKGSSVRKPKRA